jgi:hypothetical protein
MSTSEPMRSVGAAVEGDASMLTAATRGRAHPPIERRGSHFTRETRCAVKPFTTRGATEYSVLFALIK